MAKARGWKGLVGLDLAKDVTCAQSYTWDEKRWAWPEGYARRTGPGFKVVAVDYGAKRNILRCLASVGCDVTVLPATATAEDVLALNPEGVFLSNGPGDPAATGVYAVPMIQGVLQRDLPLFGICLGHQMLALALGAKTRKMNHGHHGANHPVKDLTTGKVEITSMNHGFTVDADTLPTGVAETHVSLFDGTNCGIAVTGKPSIPCSTTPKPAPARRTASTCSSALPKRCKPAAPPERQTAVNVLLTLARDAAPLTRGRHGHGTHRQDWAPAWSAPRWPGAAWHAGVGNAGRQPAA